MKNKISMDMFETLVHNFWDYMSRITHPPARAKALWFDKIKSHHEQDIIDAFDHMKDTLDRVPYNLPKAIRASAAIVIAGRTEGFEWVDYGECRDCNKSGFFSIRWFNNKHRRWYQGIRYCAACENWQNYCNEPGERVLASSLTGKFQFKPGNKCLIITPDDAIGRGSVSKIQRTAKDLVKKMPKANLHPNWQNMSDKERQTFLTKYS